MALCCEIINPATFDKKCKPTPRKGGIPYVGYVSCQIQFTDITDEEEWQAAIASGQAGVFPAGIGSKPETEKTKTRLTSCNPEQVVSQLHVLNFRTFDANLTDHSDFDEWEKVGKDWENYRFFYIDCNNLIYLDKENDAAFFPKDFELDHIIEETNEDKQFFQIVLRFEKMGIVKPFANNAIVSELTNPQGS
jgi:hypothetical protein